MADVSAVLFVKDHAKVAKFYHEALGLLRIAGDDEHSILLCGDFELVVHQMPEIYLPGIEDQLPVRRQKGRIRLDFPVDDIDRVRSTAARLGGQVDELPPAWAPRRDSNFRLGHDPEGNVFKLSERAR
jgi:predicted enzyme related to lactoylglutathione lyase